LFGGSSRLVHVVFLVVEARCPLSLGHRGGEEALSGITSQTSPPPLRYSVQRQLL
jgi:hypothetical protein